ncbi:MAG: hypothetical protein WDO18_22360 [Acidobacteriota bacterium]
MRFLWAGFLAVLPLAAQSIVTARAGMIYYAEGSVENISIDGIAIRNLSAAMLRQLNPGQVLSTPRGHAELLMGQDAALWTGNATQVRMDDTNPDGARVSLLAGSVMVELKNTRADRHLFIDLGNMTAELSHAGVYRFDRGSNTVRAYAGEATLQGPPGKVPSGRAASQGVLIPLDRGDLDELHFFAAYRSLALESEAGRFNHWHRDVSEGYKHSGFGLAFPLPTGAARVKYLAASEAGLVYYVEGNISAGTRANAASASLPFRLGRNVIETINGRAEIFLGVGIVARLSDHTRLRLVDTKALSPVASLETGEAMIEVAKSSDDSRLTVRLGDSVTELRKPGLYRFNAADSTLRVYGGESSTRYGGAILRTTTAQRVELQAPSAAAKFDITSKDTFYRWVARRSLSLYASNAGFMTGWQPSVPAGRAKHKQFGEMSYSGRPIQGRIRGGSSEPKPALTPRSPLRLPDQDPSGPRDRP